MRELEDAIAHGDLELHHQPIVELVSGRVSAMEAFLRWDHPRLGPLSPADFLPAAADGNLVGPLTVHVIDRALGDCSTWRQAGVDAGVNVNLSEANVLDAGLPGEVARLLERWRVPSNALCLEVTEKAIAADPDGARAILEGLDALGVRISIDDFGTGYSSLAALRDLPVSELKIDRSFVARAAVEQPGRRGRQLDRRRSRTSSTSRSSPRASRTRAPSGGCTGCTATARRATSSPRRCRSRRC